MNSYSETCLDASVIIRFLTSTPTGELKALWQEWTDAGVVLHAPALLRYEVVNGVHRLRKARMLSAAAATGVLTKVLRMPVVLHNDDRLHIRAFELAADHQLPVAYDAHYLALAERMNVEFWTADTKLVKAVQDRLAWVRLVS